MSMKEYTKYTASGNTTGVVNASAIVTFAGVSGKRHYLHYVAVSFASGTVSSTVTIKNGTDTIFDADFRAAGFYNLQIPTLVGGINSAVTVTATPAGAAVDQQVVAYAYTK